MGDLRKGRERWGCLPTRQLPHPEAGSTGGALSAQGEWALWPRPGAGEGRMRVRGGPAPLDTSPLCWLAALKPGPGEGVGSHYGTKDVIT